MKRVKEHEPAGWRDLCEKLQTAKDPEEFQAIVDQINRLLTAHEKSLPEASEGKPQKVVPKKGMKANAR